MENDDMKKWRLPITGRPLRHLLLAGKEEGKMRNCLAAMVSVLEKNTITRELQFSIYDGGEPVFPFHAVPGRHRNPDCLKWNHTNLQRPCVPHAGSVSLPCRALLNMTKNAVMRQDLTRTRRSRSSIKMTQRQGQRKNVCGK